MYINTKKQLIWCLGMFLFSPPLFLGMFLFINTVQPTLTLFHIVCQKYKKMEEELLNSLQKPLKL